MTGKPRSTDFIHQPRKGRMYEQHVQDPYQARGKPKEPVTCPQCGVIFHHGRWQWGEAATNARPHTCPACQRIKDHVPAGMLKISGEFFASHREEVWHLIRNLESREKAERPLERIIDISDESDALVIHFTGSHLTRATGEALQHAYQGELEYRHTDKDDLFRVNWSR